MIARAGRPVVKLVPVREQILPRKPGGWQGKVWMAPDFDDFDEEIEKLFYGETDPQD